MIPENFFFFFSIFAGLCLGSFATALTYRIPLGISILTKRRSSCPACAHDLSVRDLIPLLSWLICRGRCRYCGVAIGKVYPIIELSTALFCFCAYLFFGPSLSTLFMFALMPVVVSIIAIDLKHKIIPDGLNVAVLLLGAGRLLTGSFENGMDTSVTLQVAANAVAGAFVYGLGSWLLRRVFSVVLHREAMGLGDVKFFAASGFWLGLNAEAASALMILSGSLGILLGLFWRRVLKEEEFPFGPAIVLAFLLVLFIYKPF